MILDLFAGAGGWGEGLRLLGCSDVGIEWDGSSNPAAVGRCADVQMLDDEPMRERNPA